MSKTALRESPVGTITPPDAAPSPRPWSGDEEWESGSPRGGKKDDAGKGPGELPPALPASSGAPLTAPQRELLEEVARLYGLDPRLGEVVIAQGAPYIPLRGLLKIAHRSPRPPAGAELRPATGEERRASLVPEGAHYWRAALFQQGSNRPYVEWGLAAPEEGLERKLSARELADLAKSRAVTRALRLGWPPEPLSRGEEAQE